ncbi:MAG: HlyD family type I secretion periplasmic adaptor subunit [Alphaproteobacteria bacterium]|nr:HlyD family type I secretion periplasmic adaptor subunit [Alphaproteobacteria bacterium]
MSFFKRNQHKETGSDGRALSGKQLIFPLALEDGRVPGLLQNIAFVAGGLVVLGVLWSSVAQIRELAVGKGEVVPAGAVKNAHHLEGGIVQDVLVEEGQVVITGTPLLRLRSNAAESDLEQLSVKAASLKLQKKRLRALLRGESFVVTAQMKHYPQLARDQTDLYEAQLSLRQQEERTMQARVDQRVSEFSSLVKEIESAKRRVELTRQRVKSVKNLNAKKVVARKELQEILAEHEKNVTRHISVVGRRNAAQTAIEEARSLQLEAKVKMQKRYVEELAAVSAELAQLEQELAKQNDLVDRLIVRAPSAGTINLLPFRTRGEVIKAGDLVAKIVPVDNNIVAEVRLDPKDIGHVSIGDDAEIKISTFDPNVFGVVPGKVTKLSASTFQSDQGEVYYKATLKMARHSVSAAGTTHRITPGMLVQADVVTGRKSLVQYLLKPVYSSLNTAFTER